jgi:hypothetical protein
VHFHAALLLCCLRVLLSTQLPQDHQPHVNNSFTMFLQKMMWSSQELLKKTEAMSHGSMNVMDAHLPFCLAAQGATSSLCLSGLAVQGLGCSTALSPNFQRRSGMRVVLHNIACEASADEQHNRSHACAVS